MSNGKDIEALIKEGQYEEAMKNAEEEAKRLASKDLQTNKLREYFSQIKGIATDLKAGKKSVKQARVGLLKMKAKAAYDSKRQGVKGVEALKPLIDAFVNRVQNQNDEKTFKEEVQGFCDFFECLVGYHYSHK